jgi:hypothetical protein
LRKPPTKSIGADTISNANAQTRATCSVAAFRAFRRETRVSMDASLFAVCALANIPLIERAA